MINGLRPSLQTLWQQLSADEQARFLRHLRPYWDAHRHRLPMEIHARLQSELASGAAKLLRGRVRDVSRKGDVFALRLSSRGREQTIETDLAFDCSGHRPDLNSPLLQALLRDKLVLRDYHGLGLVALADGQVIGDGGQPTLRVSSPLGPLCQGSLWEITAVPEIVRQAAKTAEAIASCRAGGKPLAKVDGLLPGCRIPKKITEIRRISGHRGLCAAPRWKQFLSAACFVASAYWHLAKIW